MDNRQIEMEKFIKHLEKIRIKINQDLTTDTVYHCLTIGLINDKNRGNISNYFPIFIEYFKNKININVFNTHSWRYFCQFCNVNNMDKSSLFNPIKMYLSVSKENIEQVVKILFDFLEQNNICHESKITSEVRTDDIILRVFSKEDADIIHNFINNNNKIKKSLMKPNPFCYQYSNIGYAIDGELSFNKILSKYLKKYINTTVYYKENASLEGFIHFITNIYNNVFEQKIGINEFMKIYIDNNELQYFNRNELLNNYEEVTKLIMLSLQNNDFKYFMYMVDYCNDKSLKKEKIQKFNATSYENIDKKIIYLNIAILETYKKYGINQVIGALNLAYINGDYRAFTNNNNARNNLEKNVSSVEIKHIIEKYIKGNVTEYINRLVNSNINKSTSKK